MIQVEVQVVELFGLAAVDLVDALAHARLLIEDGAHQAQEFDIHDFLCNNVRRINGVSIQSKTDSNPHLENENWLQKN